MKKETQLAASYLSEYSDTVEALPLELQRNYTLIRQLDENATELMQLVAAESKQLISSDMTLEKRREKLQLVGQLLNEALKKGEEKFALAKSTYDTVDRHCTRLDNDLQKIEDEQLIGPGRVAQKPSTIINNTIKRSDPEMPETSAQKGRKKLKKGSQEAYFSKQDAIQYAQNIVSNSDLPIDPNEPVYCYCQQVSFGEMLACDNDQCEIEWFHLECVGLKTPPKGTWYCKNCTTELKKKRKN
ncbi:hypothetical protein BDF21DRAFT_69125 [Thamnidium elegans]|nr:hypothetical protein BDF21DRAFT_69125 [Thamnidium elegans]